MFLFLFCNKSIVGAPFIPDRVGEQTERTAETPCPQHLAAFHIVRDISGFGAGVDDPIGDPIGDPLPIGIDDGAAELYYAAKFIDSNILTKLSVPRYR